MELDEYIARHTSPEPPALNALYRRTHLRHLYPRMCSGHVQGRLLMMLTQMAAPKRVLEIGTFTGYATLCLAEGMPAGSRLDTVEIDDEMEDELMETFAACPYADRISLHIGDALQVVPKIADPLRPWDFVYIDANKRLYTEYFNLVMEHTSPDATIIVDNTLWDGHVLDTDAHHDAQTRGIARFNDAVCRDRRVQAVIIPVRDGMTLIRKVVPNSPINPITPTNI